MKRFVTTNRARKKQRGNARYQRGNFFLASSRKNTEPKKEIILRNSITVMKSKPDTSKPEIAGLDVVPGMK
jgi:hypothetical protein